MKIERKSDTQYKPVSVDFKEFERQMRDQEKRVKKMIQEVIELFRSYFYKRIATDLIYKEKVMSLKGKVCGCHCKPKPCHGDVYVEYLDG